MKVFQSLGVIALIASSSIAWANDKEICPNELVNFWKNFALDTENYESIPAFLLSNHCFRARTTTSFHDAMSKRFDEPNNIAHLNELHAQLDWHSKTAEMPQQQ